MGRKSKLTDKQWSEVDRRLLEGESARAIAPDFGVSEAAIRQRKTSHVESIKSVANQIVTAERALSALPITSQISAHNLAAKLRAISDNLASAAHHGAATAHRLAALANAEVQKVDDADPLSSLDAMRGVALLTKLSNDSAQTGLNLLAANKDQAKNLDKPNVPSGLSHFYGEEEADA